LKLQTLWYLSPDKPKPFWFWCLLPLTGIFYVISATRRVFYDIGLLKAYQCKAKVVVVGNISVGGNGKTPLVIRLAKYYKDKGIRTGILSRGYGGSHTKFPHLLNYSCTANMVGDEPKLMFDRLGIDVVIDPKRARGARYLAEERRCEIIICDDGLQHYALKRDQEIVVMDKREVGNGWLLPMGPLREGLWRLDKADALVFNNHSSDKIRHSDAFNMQLQSNCWVNVMNKERKSLAEFKNYIKAYFGKVTALAGIGDPQRFFDTITTLGIATDEQIGFVDHHQYTKSDLPCGMLLMTEKDAVKCVKFASLDHWYLEIEADLPSEFFNRLDPENMNINQ